jgi:hypothetical protein
MKKVEETFLHAGNPQDKVGVAGPIFFFEGPGQRLISGHDRPDFFEILLDS